MVLARLKNGEFAEAWDNCGMMGLLKRIGMITQERGCVRRLDIPLAAPPR